MSIRAVNQQTQPSIIHSNQSLKHSMWNPKIASTISKVALPVIALFAMANIRGADAGPLSYSACCIGCTSVAPPLFPACVTLCISYPLSAFTLNSRLRNKTLKKVIYMSIRAISQPTQQSIIQCTQNTGKHSTPFPKIASTVSKVALPAIALFAMANIPGAHAGPAAYAVCVEVCFASLAWFPALLPVCVFGCLPLLGAPTP